MDGGYSRVNRVRFNDTRKSDEFENTCPFIKFSGELNPFETFQGNEEVAMQPVLIRPSAHKPGSPMFDNMMASFFSNLSLN